MNGDDLARDVNMPEGARLLRTLAEVLPALTSAERAFLKKFAEEAESTAARLAEAERLVALADKAIYSRVEPGPEGVLVCDACAAKYYDERHAAR